MVNANLNNASLATTAALNGRTNCGCGNNNNNDNNLLTISSNCNGVNNDLLTINTNCGNSNDNDDDDDNECCCNNGNDTRLRNYDLNASVLPNSNTNGRTGTFNGCYRRRCRFD